MTASKDASSHEDRYATVALVRRLLTEQALPHWPLYAVAFVLMAIGAACTASVAYLIGTAINEAYVHRNQNGIVIIGAERDGHLHRERPFDLRPAVMLSRIGNRIIADNQRLLFDKLLSENIGFFADRHSSEFIARLTTGAAAVESGASICSITAIGRDLLSLIGLFAVMVVQDPVMSLGRLRRRAAGDSSCCAS